MKGKKIDLTILESCEDCWDAPHQVQRDTGNPSVIHPRLWIQATQRISSPPSTPPFLLMLCSPASKKYMHCDNQHSSCILFLAAIMLEELFSQELLVFLSVRWGTVASRLQRGNSVPASEKTFCFSHTEKKPNSWHHAFNHHQTGLKRFQENWSDTRHTQIVTVKYSHVHTACVFFGCHKDPHMIMLGLVLMGLNWCRPYKWISVFCSLSQWCWWKGVSCKEAQPV